MRAQVATTADGERYARPLHRSRSSRHPRSYHERHGERMRAKRRELDQIHLRGVFSTARGSAERLAGTGRAIVSGDHAATRHDTSRPAAAGQLGPVGMRDDDTAAPSFRAAGVEPGNGPCGSLRAMIGQQTPRGGSGARRVRARARRSRPRVAVAVGELTGTISCAKAVCVRRTIAQVRAQRQLV